MTLWQWWRVQSCDLDLCVRAEDAVEAIEVALIEVSERGPSEAGLGFFVRVRRHRHGKRWDSSRFAATQPYLERLRLMADPPS